MAKLVKEKEKQYVTFQLGKEYYAIDIMEVNEIVKTQDVRAIPNAPKYIEGLFNLRGNIIPIINLHKRFRIEKAQLTDEEKLLSGFIIISIDNTQIGIIIDKILRVISSEENQIQPPPEMVTGIGEEYIEGVIKEKEGYLIVLNIKKLFDPKELQQISKVLK